MQVCLDTASFEVVRNCWQTLLALLEEGLVDLLLCNEDEALAVAEVSRSHTHSALPSLMTCATCILSMCKRGC